MILREFTGANEWEFTACALFQPDRPEKTSIVSSGVDVPAPGFFSFYNGAGAAAGKYRVARAGLISAGAGCHVPYW